VVVRSAFTLIEILVVITIFMILMGLTIGSVVRGPNLQRMVAAEQVIADCIRQARHTARTSGQPVVLKLKKNERAISGLVRQILWHGVEGWPLRDDGGTDIPAPGRTGSGLLVPDCFQAPDDRLFATAKLEGGARLWRGQPSPTSRPGLLLSVAVRPPTAGNAGVPDLIPLALVGEDLASGYGSCEASSFGLALVQSDTGGGLAASRTTVAKSWEIIGWFGAEGAGRVEISSIANPPPDQAAITGHRQNVTIVKGTSPDVVGDAESGPLVGGRWTEISLLVEGPRLVLYRDGRRVGEKDGVGGVSLPTFAAERIYAGYMTLGGSDKQADSTQLDDVRVERLGDAMAGTLPGGVKSATDHRITCHPDGRIEIDATGSATALDAISPKAFDATSTDTTDRALRLTSDSGEEAVIEITTAGAVRSKTAVSP
jgi:type II secretory pathway pseudopilin PulG